MNIIYENLVFPFKETNLERIIDDRYFKINLRDAPQELRIHLESEMMLLVFSKSLKATCSLLQDYEKEPFIITTIDLNIFLDEFNKRYKLNATIEK
ncbi:hypothetical protein [Solibacillus sp. CAU 1738]|uniref:hypothetical protein n=1 Tax=Solibacillus sp. CAU 1738 TaxID=3140363 RepID=UPI0032615E65